MPPLLYTFRRCPYAIRARLAIKTSAVEVNTCEVDLRNKPPALLDCSPKGTVPVLQFTDGKVIEESLDIMQWALTINDPGAWLDKNHKPFSDSIALINQNDSSFKYYLDRYKYADRFPEYPATHYRQQAEVFLLELNARLSQHSHLIHEQSSLADMAILPFVRQFANIDPDWFYASKYHHVIKWLDKFLASDLFKSVIQK